MIVLTLLKRVKFFPPSYVMQSDSSIIKHIVTSSTLIVISEREKINSIFDVFRTFLLFI
jgi:hypothetical protein